MAEVPEVPEARKRNMAAIRAKDTKPELLLRKLLHQNGFRYRLHGRRLVGRPDLVFARYRAVVFVHGCFWHAHECPKFRWPRTRSEFWREKLIGNKTRDAANIASLRASGWRVAVVWECALSSAPQAAETSRRVAAWLQTNSGDVTISDSQS